MSSAATGRISVPVGSLRQFVEAVFAARGMSAEHAACVTDALIWANLRGIDTHGVNRVPRYVELIDLGYMNAQPSIDAQEVAIGSLRIEADRAPGPIAMTLAMEGAIERARIAGIGIALVRAAGVSTSPLSIAAPGGADASPIVLDIASGIVSHGRLIQARKLKQALEPGLAIDREGNPTTDPALAHVPLPMAGPKGSGLALMIELLTSVLAGNPLLAESLEGTALGKHHRQNGVCIAIDIARFIDPQVFAQEASRLAHDIHALPAADSAHPPLTPGERGDRMMAVRAQSGIPLSPPVAADLRILAQKLAIALPAELEI